MNDYSDAALLKGRFSHMHQQLRMGKQAAERKVDWGRASCENSAEAAAQEVAKHIFAFSNSLDPEKERMEVMAFSATGPIKVLGLAPGDGDILRVNGINQNNMPTSIVMHASQLSLTFSRRPVEELEDDDDGMQIGFVIFDELQERQKQRDQDQPENTQETS